MKKLLIIILGTIFAGTAFGAIINFNGRDLAVQEYNALKLELKTKVDKHETEPLEYEDAKLWIEMVNQNVKNCKLKNVTKENLIKKLNACL